MIDIRTNEVPQSLLQVQHDLNISEAMLYYIKATHDTTYCYRQQTWHDIKAR